MKKQQLFPILLIIVISFLYIGFATNNRSDKPKDLSEIKELKIGWEQLPKYPYVYYLAQNKLGGYSYDMIQAITAHHKIKVSNQTHTWTECLKNLKNNQLDIVPDASVNKKEAEHFLMSDPLYETTQVFFYSKRKYKSPPEINSLKDMKNYKFLGIEGYHYDFYNNEINFKAKAKSRRHLILSLKPGVYDFAIAQKEIILFLEKLNVLKLDNIGWIPDPVKKTRQYRVLVRKNHPYAPQLISMINAGYLRMKQSGELKKLWKKNVDAF
ncbi:MAG: extracellular solute-binding protein family 3 [Candidatus Magnetoglobus multicellularis str. Araruama]|uniref:Extracellular solute-binding protein family 3 n=1 Tax=Candidatus Magnetoglobus multicellularis str. Araruama TaxID=890399 RepID=A0A1V1PBA8_9BACT|nr:MAG: extracellular solute-binding protein family 3 [Candidatus Magnetoglobus multicellularis str. Araruama]